MISDEEERQNDFAICQPHPLWRAIVFRPRGFHNFRISLQARRYGTSEIYSVGISGFPARRDWRRLVDVSLLAVAWFFPPGENRILRARRSGVLGATAGEPRKARHGATARPQ